jgi:phosphoribosyl 1,2-cyclic phosphate phosphodiesterase
VQLQFLGTGGSQPIPLPLCDCDLCREARERGPPYVRQGYSMYLPEVNAVIDASEFVPRNLTRWGVDALDYLLLTHWHPDHTHGARVLSMRPTDPDPDETFVDAKRRTAPTVVTTRAVYERAVETLDTLRFLVEEQGYADTHFLDDEPLVVDGVRIEAVPYPLSSDGPMDATGFVIRDGDATVVVVSDDARHLDESRLPDDLTAAVFECGHFSHGPDGDRIRSPDLTTDDLAHEEVLARIERVDPDRTFLSHVSHHYGRSYDDFRRLEADYDRVRFAYDGLTVEV